MRYYEENPLYLSRSLLELAKKQSSVSGTVWEWGYVEFDDLGGYHDVFYEFQFGGQVDKDTWDDGGEGRWCRRREGRQGGEGGEVIMIFGY
jgi:hypothetical protein